MISLKLAFRSVFRRPTQNLSVLMGIALGVSLFAGVQIGSDSLAEGFVNFGVHGLGEIDASVSNVAAPFYVTNDSLEEELLAGSPTGSLFDELNVNGSYQTYVESFTTRLEISTTVIDENTGSTEISKPIVGIPIDEVGFGELYNDDDDILELETLGSGEIYIGKELSDLLFEGVDPIGRNITVITQLTSLSLPQPGFDLSYKVPLSLNLQIVDIFEDKGKGREKFTDFMAVPLSWLQDQFVKAFNEAKLNNPTDVIIGYGSSPISSILINYYSHIDSKDEQEIGLHAFQLHFTSIIGELSIIYQFSNDRQNIITGFTEAVDQINIILNVFGTIIILAGILVIINIQSMALSSREKETGILRAVGSRRYQIIFSNLTESLLVGIFGSLLGLLGGVLYGRLLLFFMGTAFGFPSSDIPTVVSRDSLTSSFIIGFVLSQATGIMPAIAASRINVAQVLRGLSTPSEEKFGRKTLYVGIFLTLFAFVQAFSLDPSPFTDGKKAFADLADVEASYLPLVSLILGPSLLYSYYGSKRGGLTVFALGVLGWALFNIFIVFDWLETGSGGLMYILYLILSLVGGSIILFGQNLKYVSSFGEKITSLFVRNRTTSPVRGTSMVAFRKMTSKPTRSTLTFALFATILTLNIFMATWSYSFRYGFDEIVVEVSSGSDVLLYTRDNAIENTIGFSDLVINQFRNSETNIEFMRSFTLAENVIEVDLDHPKHPDPWETILLTMDPNSLTGGDDIYDLKFNLGDNKTGAILSDGTELETMETPDDGPDFTIEDENVWDLFNANRTLLNKDGEERPMILTNFIFAIEGFNFEQTYYPGDSIFLNLTDGSKQEFVIGSILGSNPIVDFTLFGYEGPPVFGSVWVVNQFWASKLAALNPLEGRSNIFLGKTSESDIKSDKIDDLIRDIEIWANQKDGQFRLTYGLYGVVGLPVYDIYEVQLEGQYRFFQFLQAFVSLGFVVGILGLLVVASRSVAERKREIGMLRALGFRGRDVVVSVVLELVVMSIIGLVIGFINGTILGYALTDINSGGSATFLIPWGLIAFYLFITVFSALVAAILPAVKASRIPPSDALRYTG